ncbi:hypothetical protein CapIbe_004497 [Capra ibex]
MVFPRAGQVRQRRDIEGAAQSPGASEPPDDVRGGAAVAALLPPLPPLQPKELPDACVRRLPSAAVTGGRAALDQSAEPAGGGAFGRAVGRGVGASREPSLRRRRRLGNLLDSVRFSSSLFWLKSWPCSETSRPSNARTSRRSYPEENLATFSGLFRVLWLN